MVVKSVLSRADVSCRSLASKVRAVPCRFSQEHEAKGAISGGLARTPNECSRLYGKFTYAAVHTKVCIRSYELVRESLATILERVNSFSTLRP